MLDGRTVGFSTGSMVISHRLDYLKALSQHVWLQHLIRQSMSLCITLRSHFYRINAPNLGQSLRLWVVNRVLYDRRRWIDRWQRDRTNICKTPPLSVGDRSAPTHARDLGSLSIHSDICLLIYSWYRNYHEFSTAQTLTHFVIPDLLQDILLL
jgi:hypothetical protein